LASISGYRHSRQFLKPFKIHIAHRDLPPAIFQHIAWFTPNQTEAAFYTGSRNGSTKNHFSAEMAKLILAKGVVAWS